MDFGFWYDLAKYANDNWKGNFSEREIAISAYEYKCSWDYSIENKAVEFNILVALKNLDEDVVCGNEEAKTFAEQIREEIAWYELRK